MFIDYSRFEMERKYQYNKNQKNNKIVKLRKYTIIILIAYISADLGLLG